VLSTLASCFRLVERASRINPNCSINPCYLVHDSYVSSADALCRLSSGAICGFGCKHCSNNMQVLHSTKQTKLKSNPQEDGSPVRQCRYNR
jgi:hypothetical protein